MRKTIMTFLMVAIGFATGYTQSNKISIQKDQIEFGDGNQLGSSIVNPNYPATVSSVFASFSNGIEGNVTTSGYEDFVEIYSIDHHFIRRTGSNGLPNTPSGGNEYFVFEKPIDDASIDLQDAYRNNSTITEIVFELVVQNQFGAFMTTHKITLNNVKIVQQRIDILRKESGGFQAVERYTVAYATYEFEDIAAGSSVSIPWNYAP